MNKQAHAPRQSINNNSRPSSLSSRYARYVCTPKAPHYKNPQRTIVLVRNKDLLTHFQPIAVKIIRNRPTIRNGK